ncbi:hypothetical protein M3Y99_01327800 [Aphelenchoides fujianensis]|nr:hypothetical protein M3Y99_01553200 [Aphelenchoides fujianensis]KAI6226115.1 hypothetical protein M3Y99_01327800 [Aphelenchoides fujianensis]
MDYARTSPKNFDGEILHSILADKTSLHEDSPVWGGLDLLHPQLNDVADNMARTVLAGPSSSRALAATGEPSESEEPPVATSSQELRSGNKGV